MATYTHRFHEHTILLAEDAEINKEIALAILKPTGVTIDFAATGLDAVNMFQKQPDLYSLILMDVHMPEMDGYEATRQIRSTAHPAAKSIPIIALTANVFWEDISRGQAAGMNDHIGKPLDPELLISRIKQHLPDRNYSKVPELDLENKQSIGYAAYLPLIDVYDGLGRLMDNKKLYLMSLEKFLENNAASELVSYLSSGNLSKTAQTAHALMGVSGNLGLAVLYNATSKIESLAKNNADPSQLLESFQQATETTKECINKLIESRELA
jgi:CheY-like chemotaxis protein/HPt (histidine-containing phosphotransfer) domain-containing protein